MGEKDVEECPKSTGFQSTSYGIKMSDIFVNRNKIVFKQQGAEKADQTIEKCHS